jgi:SPP1 gp7 family putative phage head morphogenesis protein
MQASARRDYRLRTNGCPTCLQSSSYTADRFEGIDLKSAFIRAKKLERNYAARLRKIAGHIGDIVNGFNVQDLPGAQMLQAVLNRYAATLTPWAEAVANRMVTEVAARDERAWIRVSQQMGQALRREIATAPTGEAMRTAMAAQVKLITSLPTEAGQRVHDLVIAGISEGRRAEDVAKEIARSGEVSDARARLIARTEVSRTATMLTQARAQHIGSTHYIWRTAGDSDVRPTHKALNGKTIAWNDPPECDPGYRAHAGAIFNCRCYCEPIIPEA